MRSSGTAIVAGAAFVVVGVLTLLERLFVIRIGTGWIWPTLLIALGIAVLLGGDRRAVARRDVRPSPPADDVDVDAPGS